MCNLLTIQVQESLRLFRQKRQKKKKNIFFWEKGLIYPSTLSFGADMPLVMKVAHIYPYRYTNGSHIPLPLQNELTYTLHLTEVKKLVLNLYF